MNKKLLSMALGLALCLGLVCPALAAGPTKVTQGETTYVFSNGATLLGTFTEQGRGETYPLYQVPMGTVVTIEDGAAINYGFYIEMEEGEWYFDWSASFESCTVEDDEVHLISKSPELGLLGTGSDYICIQTGSTVPESQEPPAPAPQPAPAPEVELFGPGKAETVSLPILDYGTFTIENAAKATENLDLGNNFGVIPGQTVYYVPEGAKITAVLDNPYEGMVVNAVLYVPNGTGGYDLENHLLQTDGTFHLKEPVDNFFDFRLENGVHTFQQFPSEYVVKYEIGESMEFGVSSYIKCYVKVGGAAEPSAPLAYARDCAVTVQGGEGVTVPAYALKDENGFETNYFRVRDVAKLLGGTEAQFSVAWDGSVRLERGAAYTSDGSELSTPFSGDRAYTAGSGGVLVDGVEAPLESILLTDDAGNGYTYFKLRDLGAALGFGVDWDASAGIVIAPGGAV